MANTLAGNYGSCNRQNKYSLPMKNTTAIIPWSHVSKREVDIACRKIKGRKRLEGVSPHACVHRDYKNQLTSFNGLF